MKVITREDISGAKITDVHSVTEVIDKFNCSTVYFSVDQGFTFNLPLPGRVWHSVRLPNEAKPIPDEWDNVSYGVKRTLFGRNKLIPKSSERVDFVKKVKALRIVGVYCSDVDESGFFSPEEVHLLFNDKSMVYCVSAAPQGIPVGMFYLTEDEYSETGQLVDYFDLRANKKDE